MKLLKTITVLALTAGLFVSCTKNEHEGGKLIGDTHQAVLTAAPVSQKIAKDGTAAVTFTFSLKSPDGLPLDISKYTATLSFEATGGSVSPTSATTDADGAVTVVFTTPGDNYYFNYHSIEIDPASDNYDKLYYNDYGPYIQFNHTIPVGEYKLILRCKADHSVKCTVPYKMVKHKVTSFSIVPHEFALFYGTAGKVLDVEVQPEDATWDWTDVEIASNSETFNFYPSTHTIAINKLAAGADAHVLGVQVKFWLKSNHNVYDYIYIDMNQSSQ